MAGIGLAGIFGIVTVVAILWTLLTGEFFQWFWILVAFAVILGAAKRI